MNREIEFRGKSKYNKEWVYGYLIGNDLITSGIKINCPLDLWENIKRLEEWEEVDPETVGQYTGLKDKNDAKIYEGDIVQLDNSDQVNMWVRGEKGVAIWNPSRFLFKWKNGETNVLKEGGADVIQIVGNIYENPELLDQQA